MSRVNLKNMQSSDLESYMVSIGEKKFRAKQIFKWIYSGAESFDDMTNIAHEFKIRLKAGSYIENIEPVEILKSKKDKTRKYLFKLDDGNVIESVFMKYKHGNSVCISSQVGCKMGCAFCASTIGGIKRNLTASEMIDQILKIQKDTGEKIGNIVVMGSGEPFDNYTELLSFLKLVNDPEGLNVGMRNITVSTCGLISYILKFAKDMPQVNLAISLHASSDEKRDAIMPINKKYDILKLLTACHEYIKITNRRITFEYALIKGQNDSKQDAVQLAELLEGMLCHVNIIPLNSVKESKFSGSDRDTAEKFESILKRNGINATIRRELGTDIDAACGQLRRKHI